MTRPPAILWFRNDLRLADHPALSAAAAEGRPVLPVFVLDEAAEPGGAAKWWLHHSLAALAADLRKLGAPLILRRGVASEHLLAIARETGAAVVHAGDSAAPRERAREAEVAAALEAAGIAFHRHRTSMLFDPERLRTQAGAPFQVYTPFARACHATGGPPPPPPAPHRLHAPARPPSGERLDDWQLLPTRPDWAGRLRATWRPGEATARARLGQFLAEEVADYAAGRDRPRLDVTSRLSPHLRWGEISPAGVWHDALAVGGPGVGKFISELLWREFSYHLLWHFPHLPDRPLRPAFSAMPWRDDPAGLRAWRRGRTGVPIVDAGMRQLWNIGWMHNRVRLIAASFLVKHLLIDWRQGAAWFLDTLVDADLANNSASWQWVAGSGAELGAVRAHLQSGSASAQIRPRRRLYPRPCSRTGGAAGAADPRTRGGHRAGVAGGRGRRLPAPAGRSEGGPGAGAGGVCDARLMTALAIPDGAPLRVVGDVHGDAAAFAFAAATDRFVVQLGDLVDQGPRSDEVLRMMFRLIDEGRGLFLLGNHEHKLARALAGQAVRPEPGLEATLAKLDPALRARAVIEIARAPVWLRRGDTLFVHAGFHTDMLNGPAPAPGFGRARGAVARALFGELTGRMQADRYPERSLRWVHRIPEGITVYCGHDRRSADGRPYVRRGALGGTAIFLDTGAGKGGHLSWIDLPS